MHLTLKRYAVIAAACLLCSVSLAAQTPVVVQNSGDPAKRVDIMLVGDGYTSAEQSKFATDVTQFMNGVFAQEPFKEYRNYINVRRIDVVSNESGADHPERIPPVFKDTAFDATYNCSNIQRLICVSTSKVLNVVGVVPPSQRDLVVVIVNDSEYGGSGGSVAVASTHASAVELILHETGHTFAFLADEYTSQPPACSDAFEPSEVNATKQTSRASIKWLAWIDPSTPVPTPTTTLGVPGLYQGSKYCPTTLYRPTYDSKMRSLGRSYDQINTEQFVKRFYAFATPVESQSPAATSLDLTQGQDQPFTLTTPQPATHTLTITWRVDGVQVATGPAYLLSTSGLPPGPHTITATAVDNTPMVRINPVALTQETSWTLNLAAGAKKRRSQVTSQ